MRAIKFRMPSKCASGLPVLVWLLRPFLLVAGIGRSRRARGVGWRSCSAGGLGCRVRRCVYGGIGWDGVGVGGRGVWDWGVGDGVND